MPGVARSHSCCQIWPQIDQSWAISQHSLLIVPFLPHQGSSQPELCPFSKLNSPADADVNRKKLLTSKHLLGSIKKPRKPIAVPRFDRDPNLKGHLQPFHSVFCCRLQDATQHDLQPVKTTQMCFKTTRWFRTSSVRRQSMFTSVDTELLRLHRVDSDLWIPHICVVSLISFSIEGNNNNAALRDAGVWSLEHFQHLRDPWNPPPCKSAVCLDRRPEQDRTDPCRV